MKKLRITLAFFVIVFFSIPNTYSQISYSDHILGGMTCVIVQHQVKDFDKWYVAYNKDEDRRKQAKLYDKMVLRGVEDPNFITIVLEMGNNDSAKNFFANSRSVELMQTAGVINKPILTYFKVNNSGIPAGESFLIVRHTVKDYNFWKQEFDKHQNERKKYKLSLTALGQDMENALNVVGIFNNENKNNIQSFLEKSNLKEAMKDAGITNEPKLEIMTLHRD